MCVCVCVCVSRGKSKLKKFTHQTSLAVQRLRLWASSAGGAGSIPSRGTKIPQAALCGKKKKKKGKVTHTSIQSFAYNSRVLITTEKLSLRIIKLNQETKTKTKQTQGAFTSCSLCPGTKHRSLAGSVCIWERDNLGF